MAKHTTLEQLKKLATRTKTELDGLDTKIKALGSVYTPKGSCTFEDLTTNAPLDADHLGHVWNVTDAFETTENFLEGAGKSYPAGSNVVVVDEGEASYKYDVLSGAVDLSAYAKKTDIPEPYVHPTGDGNEHVPATGTDNENKVLTAGATAGDIKWGHKVESDVPADAKFTDTTYETFKGATEEAGSDGLVPGPQAEEKDLFLKGDGTWAKPTDTTYEDATTDTHGLMSVEDKQKLDGIETASDEEVDAMLKEVFQDE